MYKPIGMHVHVLHIAHTFTLTKAIYGLLPMAKLAEPLMGIRNAGKARNRKVEKSQTVLITIHILAKNYSTTAQS